MEGFHKMGTDLFFGWLLLSCAVMFHCPNHPPEPPVLCASMAHTQQVVFVEDDDYQDVLDTL